MDDRGACHRSEPKDVGDRSLVFLQDLSFTPPSERELQTGESAPFLPSSRRLGLTAGATEGGSIEHANRTSVPPDGSRSQRPIQLLRSNVRGLTCRELREHQCNTLATFATKKTSFKHYFSPQSRQHRCPPVLHMLSKRLVFRRIVELGERREVLMHLLMDCHFAKLCRLIISFDFGVSRNAVPCGACAPLACCGWS